MRTEDRDANRQPVPGPGGSIAVTCSSHSIVTAGVADRGSHCPLRRAGPSLQMCTL